MFKKILLSVFTFILLVFTVVAFLIYLQIEVKPDTKLAVVSGIQKQTDAATKLQADEWISDLYSSNQIPSISAAIGIKGELKWAGAIGYSDLKNETLANTHSLYRIGSVSKSLTAAALMTLNEKKVIDINHSFYYYVKDFPLKPEEFTVKQLASHQAGIRHYSNGVGSLIENFNNVEYVNTREAARIIENDELLFSPGTNFNYTTYGYTLLSLAMERAAGRPFEEIMQKEVFDAAGMSSTFFDTQSVQNKNSATPYIYLEHTLFKAPQVNLSYKYAGGGFISTPSDLVKFGQALLANKLMSVEAKSSMWSPVPLSNGKKHSENYAIGFSANNDELGHFINHGGKSVGGYTYFVIYPESEIVVALTMNVTPNGSLFDRHNETKKLIKIFTNQ